MVTPYTAFVHVFLLIVLLFLSTIANALPQHMITVTIYHTATAPSSPLLVESQRAKAAQQTSSISPTSSASPDVDFSDDTLFRNTVLQVTNSYRAQHNASSLVWDDSLAQSAVDYADWCIFDHSGGSSGENLATGYTSASDAIRGWAEEGNRYDFQSGRSTGETGHFTQLVWKSTRRMGCGRHQCGDAQDNRVHGKISAYGWYLVCEYLPAGNIAGAFFNNVQAQVSSNTSETPTAPAPSKTTEIYPGQSVPAAGAQPPRADCLWMLMCICIVMGLQAL